MSEEEVDPKIFKGCYVKRFYSPFEKGNMWQILDAKGNCDTGDFQYDDGTWRDIEDSVVITNDPDLKPIGELPWVAYVGDEKYSGYNPFTYEMVNMDLVEDMEDYGEDKTIGEIGFEVFDKISDLVQQGELEDWIKSLEDDNIIELYKLLGDGREGND